MQTDGEFQHRDKNYKKGPNGYARYKKYIVVAQMKNSIC